MTFKFTNLKSVAVTDIVSLNPRPDLVIYRRSLMLSFNKVDRLIEIQLESLDPRCLELDDFESLSIPQKPLFETANSPPGL
jgi:hypothetical protein